jgi:PAS domain S-box-containing protein
MPGVRSLPLTDILEATTDLVGVADAQGRTLYLNRAGRVMLGIPADEDPTGTPIVEFHPPWAAELVTLVGIPAARATGSWSGETVVRRRDGQEVPISQVILAHRSEDGDVECFSTIIRDITERKRNEEELARREHQLAEAQHLAHLGSWEWEIAEDRVTWSDELYRIFGFDPTEFAATQTDYLNRVHPDDRPFVESMLEASLRGHHSFDREYQIVRPDGDVRVIHGRGKVILDEAGRPVRMLGAALDITDRKHVEAQLLETAAAFARQTVELTRSNADLEQFAYVASHDLQEPLRMVASYTQLLARRYRGKLDPEADEFIAFASNGAIRMQNLINDLLTYSRIGTRNKPFELTDVNLVFETVVHDLATAIAEENAVVTRDELPSVVADASQLRELLLNLVGNAIKFHGPAKPRVHVSVETAGRELVFTVNDNGIGIEPQYVDRIFIIFQRLHTQAEYPGTGIGLAICKKIVERHAGRIWLESCPGVGSAFHFTLAQTAQVEHGLS